MLATDVVLSDGSSTSLAQQAEAAGAKTLMMTGNPDRIIEFEGAGQPYLSKPFPLDLFLQRGTLTSGVVHGQDEGLLLD